MKFVFLADFGIGMFLYHDIDIFHMREARVQTDFLRADQSDQGNW
jgi:hypothetical protein